MKISPILRLGLALLLLASSHSPARALDWNVQTQGEAAFALAQGEDGFWVATQDHGVWRRDGAGNWRGFTRADGLGDDSALCLARRGSQIWVGHARGGLSVWDGQKWTNLGVEEGLPSERVTALSVAGDGAVWIATEGGILRWDDENGWFRPDSALCHRSVAGIASAGELVVAATSCEGLILSRDGGKSWEEVRGPGVQPATPAGEGLPSDVLNDVKIDALGQIWVASDTGFARSDDGGKNWFWVRGNDWKANVEGSAAGLKPQNAALSVDLAAEDWVQTLAPTPDGKIWLGFRQKGVELRDCKSGETLFASPDDRSAASLPTGDWVRSIFPLPGDRALTARYGGGVVGILKADFPRDPAEITAGKFKVPTPLPTLDAAGLGVLAASKNALNTVLAPGSGAWDSLDFRTQGDWVGRYGDRFMRACDPYGTTYNRTWGASFEVQVGPHLAPGAVGPYTYYTQTGMDNRRALYFPAQGKRRLGELNDGSWQSVLYPNSWEGPDLWALATVPAGVHRMALYFVNGDGAGEGMDRYRDFVVSLRAYTPDKEAAMQVPALARARLRDASGGVYARFSVAGPAKFWLQIERHHSFVTKISGLFLDHIAGDQPDPKARAWEQNPLPWMGGVRYVTEATPPAQAGENETIAAARRAWQSLDAAAEREDGLDGLWQTRLAVYRAAKASGADEKLLANWRWKLALWHDNDREEFDATMQDAWTKEKAQRDEQAQKPRTAADLDAAKADLDAAMAAEKAAAP